MGDERFFPFVSGEDSIRTLLPWRPTGRGRPIGDVETRWGEWDVVLTPVVSVERRLWSGVDVGRWAVVSRTGVETGVGS